ncbi:MAG: hypothetical protein K2P55_02310 [Bacteroides acidifaciens]|uniref:hypothetical protein n=1 Tax=Bacteroides acidifaciens TaxID=85831 RepID=UPI0023BD4F31|nr:hypothetical protein [Bacteroides acidifaciens]MDE6985783.1 hypothetical protein [Bacteroides acidifaciens]
MKIKGLILILASVLLTTNIMAQDKQKTFFKGKSNKERIENVDSIKLVADSLHRELVRRDSVLRVNINLIDSIRSNAFRLTVSANRQRDSLLNIIRLKDREITTLKANTGFVDTCMVKLANRWLYERFDKADIDEAIKYFDRIYSSKLKEEMSIVQELLRNYERSYREFQSIMKEAQSDIDRESPFACEQYRDKYKRKIENMMYYWKYYKEEWNIRYLNEQMDKAIQIINNHKDGKFADFSTLIDPNF